MTKPPNFDQMSDQLWDAQLRELQDLWTSYHYLYVEDPERTAKLRRPGWGGFFWSLVQRCMISETILLISRLTDPPEMGKRRNLTLRALLDDPRLSDQLRCNLRRELTSIRKSIEKIRKHRHRVVAHIDEPTALGQETLPILQVGQIEDVISKLQDVHRKHRAACMGRDVFEYGTQTLGGVEKLVTLLEQSERVRQTFAHASRDDEDKLRDWDRARREFFLMGP